MNFLKNPVFWFILVVFIFGVSSNLGKDELQNTIRSDGRGYYAYLPSFFIYNDHTFQKSFQVEKKYYPSSSDQLYLFKDKKGKFYNKYYPGVALLQTPFFSCACFISWFMDWPVDGYSSVFLICFYLGSLFYSIVGILLFSKFLRRMFPESEIMIRWLLPCFYIATPLFFYITKVPSNSHLYSFFLFGLTANILLNLRDKFRFNQLLFLGFVTGLVLLVRPTNISIVLLYPIFFFNKEKFMSFIEILKSNKIKYILLPLLVSSLPIILLLSIWKWETRNWILWSYNGEGFNFSNPKIWSALFSFRNGLFLNSPIIIFTLIGLFLLYKNHKFIFQFWLIYFLFNVYLFSSWWCWDFESSFGNRAYTEHWAFILIPCILLIQKYRNIFTLTFLTLCSLTGIVRFWEIDSGYMVDQRFTKENYLKSLVFWKKENFGRWNFTRSSKPFGLKYSETYLTIQDGAQNIQKTDEFTFGKELLLVKSGKKLQHYYSVELEKKQNEEYFENVFLVIDAFSKDKSKRYYKAVDLFNDRKEGTESWTKLMFEGQIHDNLNEYEFVNIYIWNLGKKEFEIKNYKSKIESFVVE